MIDWVTGRGNRGRKTGEGSIVRISNCRGILAREEDSGKEGAADGIIELLLDLYQHELYILRVLSPRAIEILVKAE
jgi:hypothetical protein